ncbi:MAG: hypothetical protein M3N29_10730 [Chloroflexota bacterium]|nr:hypothetical protein [Chloroflexota bacterium]
MARNTRNDGGSTQAEGAEDVRTTAVGIMSEAQERVRAGAEKAAEVLPDAVASAQVAARESQRALREMSDQSLMIGASFSIGLSVGLFISGANRLLVFFVLAPAAAMLATLLGREQGTTGQLGGPGIGGAA